MTALWQDIRYGLRMLGKNPGFTAVAVLTLALGIGANTAIFTLINALLLKSLPAVKDPQQLVLLMQGGLPCVSYPHYERLRDDSQSLAGLFASSWIGKHKMRVMGSGAVKTEYVWAQGVSGNFFSVLGAPAALGRTLTPNDDRPGDPQPVVVISHDFWRRRFGQDPAVIGRTVTLEDVPVTIVGVAPQGFFGFVVGSRLDFWWPIQMIAQVEGKKDILTQDGFLWLQAAGRLKPGVSAVQACADLNVVFQRMLLEKAEKQRLSEEDRQSILGNRLELRSAAMGYSPLWSGFWRLLSVLMVIVGVVLLVACTNLAGLLLARGAVRQREFSVRAALGADRWALVRQLVTESLLLAAAGGALGLLLAQGGVRVLANYLCQYGETAQLQLTPDLRILTFTFLVSVGTGLLFGLLPAWRTTRLDLVTTLKDEAGGLLGRGSGPFGNKVLVVAQVALTCLLLIGAGLFVRTLVALKTLDTGFHRENLLVFGLDSTRDYDKSRRVQVHLEILRQLEDLPGVQSATLASFSLGGGGRFTGSKLTANPAVAKAGGGLECEGMGIAPSYLQTMAISLLAGRDFSPDDLLPTDANTVPPPLCKVILGESLARRLFSQEDPVGKRLWQSGASEPTMEVIGVARDTRQMGLKEKPSATLLYYVDVEYSRATFYVRTQGNALSMVGGMRRLVHDVAPDVEVTGLRTMEDLVNDQLVRERALSVLASFFGLLALVLACLGLYGILSYAVAQRTREIGIRMALGAQKYNVLSAVIRQGMTLTLLGCALGVILAVALTRAVSSLLYGVTPTDPLTFVLTVLLLGVVAFVSCWLPARRAARIDPMVALRYE
jgi:predicted permease